MQRPCSTLGVDEHVDSARENVGGGDAHRAAREEDPDAIVEIWREYHEGKNASFGARVNPGTYRAFRDRTAKCPMFVVPLHKSPSKFLTLVMQAKEPYASFTAIDDFRKLQEAATPMLVAAHYPELVESKGLVLVQAK